MVSTLTSTTSHFKLLSKVFNHTQLIPNKYTPFGKDINPPLKWENPPEGTKSFALLVDDPDAPHGVFVHWAVFNIDHNLRNIKEGEVPGEQVKNSWGIKEYKGPKPPFGTHRYFFKLYALNVDSIKVKNLEEFREKVREHELGEAQLMGKFEAK